MKTFIKLLSTTLITITLFTINPTHLLAQDPPPPPDHNSSGNVPGGGAPIAGGLGILLILGATYGAKKVYDIQKRKLAE